MSRTYDIPKVTIKLSGADVIEVLVEADDPEAIDVEILQYHADHWQTEEQELEFDWPHARFEVVWPDKAER